MAATPEKTRVKLYYLRHKLGEQNAVCNVVIDKCIGDKPEHTIRSVGVCNPDSRKAKCLEFFALFSVC